ncbi:MAG: rhodanese-like domain-containing protein [Clostridia bacterium]|nr:rhodanese-like domain-containing protein [Clostridia bacterium]
MLKKWIIIGALTLGLIVSVTGCGKTTAEETPTQEIAVETQEEVAVAYTYYTQDELKEAIESQSTFALVDIQVAEDYAAHHIIGAIETNAYPVKTEEEQQRLDSVIEANKEGDAPIIIVCPRGAGGAERTYQYMEEQGIPAERLFILENGQEGWTYEELLEK